MIVVSIITGVVLLVLIFVLGTVFHTPSGKGTYAIPDVETDKRHFETLEDAQKYADETDAEILKLRKEIAAMKNDAQGKQDRVPWFKFAIAVLAVSWLWQCVSAVVGLIAGFAMLG